MFIDYADTTINIMTLTVTFEDFSLTLKEQSGEIKYLVVLTLQ